MAIVRRRGKRAQRKRVKRGGVRKLSGVSGVTFAAGGASGSSTFGNVGPQNMRARAFPSGQVLAGRKRMRDVGLRVRRRRRPGAVGGDISFRDKVWKPITYKPDLLLRTLNKQREFVIHRYQGVNRMNANNDGISMPGYYYLHNNTDIVAGSTTCPIHWTDLTSYPNVTQPGVLSVMTIADNAEPAFNPLPGQTNTGGTSTEWQVERTSANQNGPYIIGARYITTEWIDIRLNLYGCNTQPTVYDVFLLRVTDDYMSPGEVVLDTEAVRRRRIAFTSMVSTQMYNPIMPGYTSWQRGVQILRKYRKVIQPSSPFGSSDVVDKNPHNHVLRIFYADSRTRDYQWATVAPTSDTTSLTNQWTIVTANGTTSKSNAPQPKSQLFLVVRALNTTVVPTDLVTAANTPSYDMVIRRKASYFLN